jgi:hypothetical protein
MSNKKNIEDIFRSELEGYTQTPSNKVWNGINKKMIGPRFESMYRNAFNGYKIAPADQTWRRIAAAVWFNKFIHFTPFHFNIYYLGIVVTAVVGTVVTVNNNPNLDFFHFNDNFENADKTIVQEIDNENPLTDIFDYRNAVPKNTNNEIDSEDNIKIEENTSTTIISNEVSNSNNNEIITNPNNSKSQNVITINQNAITAQNNNKDNELESSTEIVDDVVEETINKTYYKLNRLLRNKNHSLTYQPTPFELADKVILGIPEQDQITYDTLGVDYHGNPILSEKSYFAIDLYFTPYWLQYNTAVLNSELQTNFENYQNNINPNLSFSAGIGFAYSYNKIRFETGIGYLQMQESFNSTINSHQVSEHSYYNYFDKEVWQTYTVNILDLDEYLQGNIVYYEHTDSILNIVPDSTLISYMDSVLISKDANAQNIYHIVDVPVVFGYEIGTGKFSVTPKAGIIGSMLIKRDGTYYNITHNDIMSTNDCPDTKFLFDYYGALNLQYKIGNKISLYVEPHIRVDINSMYDNSYALSQKSRKLGIKTGFYFKF